METLISACGLNCAVCSWYPSTCSGCHSVKGSTFWAKEALPKKTCMLYSCSVNDKGYTDCGECDELPCKRFFELKDPNTSQEDHVASIQVRVAQLKGIQ